MYPRIVVDLNKLKENIVKVKELAGASKRSLSLVTKLIGAYPEIIKEFDEMDFDYFADSRVENLEKLRDLKTPKLLLRIPMIQELEEVLKFSQMSCHSEIKTLRALDALALKENKFHDVVLMVDLGDLREGFFKEEHLFQAIEEIQAMKGLNLKGIASNLSCYGAIRPTEKNQKRLVKLAREIELMIGTKLDWVSGGSTNCLYLEEQGKLPDGITNLRLGEAIFMGTEPSFGKVLPGMHQDVFKLEASVIECKVKPSIPIGEQGYAAFRTKPVFKDLGNRTRVLLAIGKQDVDMDGLYPLDEGCSILGGSSDHLIVDVSDAEKSIDIGDVMSFKMSYLAVLRSFTSFYVKKVIKGGEEDEA